jgi:hypothetical protein
VTIRGDWISVKKSRFLRLGVVNEGAREMWLVSVHLRELIRGVMTWIHEKGWRSGM